MGDTSGSLPHSSSAKQDAERLIPHLSNKTTHIYKSHTPKSRMSYAKLFIFSSLTLDNSYSLHVEEQNAPNYLANFLLGRTKRAGLT